MGSEMCIRDRECTKSDEESEDGFFVPDGYLSEDEVEVWCFYWHHLEQ